jgi:hypothetical protein
MWTGRSIVCDIARQLACIAETAQMLKAFKRSRTQLLPLPLAAAASCILFLMMIGCTSFSPSSQTNTFPFQANLHTSEKDISPLTSPGSLMNASAPLITPSYEGSGQVVEPTVLHFPNGWQGYFYWMAISPYPHIRAQASFENPSILVSQDGQNWSVPSGLTNPIAVPNKGHFADATLFFDDESDQLWVYFLNDVSDIEYRESLLRITSADGIHWSAPEVLMSARDTFVNSPSVGKVDSTYYLWSINSGVGCLTGTSTMDQRTSQDGVNWSAPLALNVSQPGYVLWHLNVIAVPSEAQFMSLLAAYPVGSNCDYTKLFFANSRDGIHWLTYPQPVLDTGTGWDSLEIYRSSLIYDPNSALFRVWYSARDAVKWEWHVGYSEKFSPML